MKILNLTLIVFALSGVISLILNPNIIQLRPASKTMLSGVEKYNIKYCALCNNYLNEVKKNDLFVSVHNVSVSLELALLNKP